MHRRPFRLAVLVLALLAIPTVVLAQAAGTPVVRVVGTPGQTTATLAADLALTGLTPGTNYQACMSATVTAPAETTTTPAGCVTFRTADPPPPVDYFRTPYAGAAWLYGVLPANPAVDPGSAAMVANLDNGGNANIYAYGLRIWNAPTGTPVRRVDCLQTGWGVCNLENRDVPLTSAMLPTSGTDKAMSVIDVPAMLHYGFWQYTWRSTGLVTTTWGDVARLDGPGNRNIVGGPCAETGAGFCRSAGVVRAHEIRAGTIPHALIFSTQYCQTGVTRFPATKNDGKYSGGGAVPEGARVFLPRTLAMPSNLNAVERMVFKALQEHGAYAMDCGGAPMAFIFETPPPDDPNVYTSNGFPTGDYVSLTRIPFAQLRVAASSVTPQP